MHCKNKVGFESYVLLWIINYTTKLQAKYGF